MALGAIIITTLAPRVHRTITRRLRSAASSSGLELRLRAAASAPSFSTPTPTTTRTAPAQATDSTSELQAPPRVVLVQAGVFRRLRSCPSGGRKHEHVRKNYILTWRWRNCRCWCCRRVTKRLCAALVCCKALALRPRPLVCKPPWRVGFEQRIRHRPLQPQHHRRRERPRQRPPSQRENYKHRFGWSLSKPVYCVGFSGAWVVREGMGMPRKALSIRPRPPVCTASWRGDFEQRLRHHPL